MTDPVRDRPIEIYIFKDIIQVRLRSGVILVEYHIAITMTDNYKFLCGTENDSLGLILLLTFSSVKNNHEALV